ncbi:hypothetical protein AB0G04_39600 [Actinoplanes sp. NPDC023801]|uniref:hypothetical protein n=1 Tax=Actinoplanes sp. NPDC023801 TaxID=3154595 RepID=UPI0033D4ABA6
MADQQPGDTAPAAGMPDPTRFAGSGEPATADLPGRWSGAAAVPEASPRRSLWSRMADRINGTAPGPDPEDDRTAVPAVDPWADQDTPVWQDAYSTPAATTPLPETRLDIPGPPPPRLDVPGSPPTRLDVPGQPLTRLDTPPARLDTPAVPEPAAAQRPAGTPDPMRGAPSIPAPGTYPPPAAGAGLPPLLPPKLRAWGRRAAARSQQAAADAPEKLRALGQQAAAKGQQVAAGAPDKLRQVTAGAPEKLRQVTGSAPDKLRQVTGSAPEKLRQVTGSAPEKLRPAAAGTPRKPGLFSRRPAAQPAPVQRRPSAAPPWAPPKPRRKRRLRRFAALAVIGLALAYWFVPGVRQYPVTASLPSSFADLELRDNASGRRAAQRLAEQLQETGADGGAFAGIYADGRGKRVTVFGVTGLRLTPGADVRAQLDRLTDAIDLKNVQSFDIGGFAGLGAQQECGTGRLDGTSVVACTWADHGSLATVLLTRRSVTDSADLVARLRTKVLNPT